MSVSEKIEKNKSQYDLNRPTAINWQMFYQMFY